MAKMGNLFTLTWGDFWEIVETFYCILNISRLHLRFLGKNSYIGGVEAIFLKKDAWNNIEKKKYQALTKLQ